MSHLASHDFWRCFAGLPAEAQELAEKTFAKIKSNPQDRSLHFTKIACCWLVCIGAHHRALAVQVAQRLVWFWIGNYSDYTALVRREAASHAALPSVAVAKRPQQKSLARIR